MKKYTEKERIANFWKRVKMPSLFECWEWTGGVDGCGYGQLRGNNVKLVKAHRFSYILANGEIPKGMCVLHTCDNPPCCNPDHLFLGTHADNSQDKVNKGRQSKLKGERAGRAKLTDKNVREIRSLIAKGWVYTRIARRFGVGKSTIGYIGTGETWTHVI